MLVDWSVTQPPKKKLEWIEVGRNGILPQVFGQCPATQPCDEYLKFSTRVSWEKMEQLCLETNMGPAKKNLL